MRNKLTNSFFVFATILIAVFTLFFGIYEYRREHAFRVDILHSQLQLNNYHVVPLLFPRGGEVLTLGDLNQKVSPRGDLEGVIRVTVIDTLGNVLYDTEEADVRRMGNHLQREEIQEALMSGCGYAIKRASETNGEKYFYSATYFKPSFSGELEGWGGILSPSGELEGWGGVLSPSGELEGGLIIRSSVPYSAELTSSLEHDYTFFYYTAGIFALIATALYFRSRYEHSEQEKQRIKRQLTENAAHELKTPAATIGGYLETLVENPNMPEEKRNEFIERCYTQSKRMSRLLLDMSTLTQLDSPSPAFPQSEGTIDVVVILRQIVDDTKLQFENKNIELLLDLPERMPMLADASLIYSMLQNIFSNTLAYATDATYFKVVAKEIATPLSRFSSPFGEHLGVRSGRGWVIRFIDNGVGVSSEHLSHLFERFYRTDKGRSRRLGGTGLGLAIVKNIAVRYGGYATAINTIGGGLTIEIGVSNS